MRKSTLAILIIIVLFGFGSLLLLHRYKLHLIHTVVENAVIQKAPAGYPAEKIKMAFEENRRRADELNQEERYLQKLLAAAQQLEKVQSLNENQIRDLIVSLGP